MRLTRRASLAAALAAPAAISPAGAQTYPDRSVRVIIPYSAGGVADTIARTIQPKMAEHLGQSVVVENRTGASGAIAAAALAQSAPDGHTFMMEGATFATLPLVSRSLPVDYETAFIPVAQVTSQPYYLAVHQNFPAEDFAGFLAAARARPGVITYGTPGHAHIGHFMGELIQLKSGIRLEHIPYRGGADASREVGAGRIDAAIISHSSLIPALQANRARLIAVTSAERRPLTPETPAIAEILPGYDLVSWTGFFAPAGTPSAILTRFTQALHHAIADAPTRERLIAGGNDPILSDAAAYAALIRRDRAVARDIVANAPGLRG